MERRPRVARATKWEFDGVEYVWTGTRKMAQSWLKGVKGYSHDMKAGSFSSLLACCDSLLSQLMNASQYPKTGYNANYDVTEAYENSRSRSPCYI
jgi:hypothetical protein